MRVVSLGIGTSAQMQRDRQAMLLCNCKLPTEHIPLHIAPAGKRFGEFHGEDKFTTKESERLLRLPMYYNLTDADSDKVIEKVIEFYKG